MPGPECAPSPLREHPALQRAGVSRRRGMACTGLPSPVEGRREFLVTKGISLTTAWIFCTPRRSLPLLSICINTQTPLAQFLTPVGGTGREGGTGAIPDLTQLREGVDYRYSPGGVTRMVYPMVRRLLHEQVLREAHWIALNPHAPATVRAGELTLHNVSIPEERMAGY